MQDYSQVNDVYAYVKRSKEQHRRKRINLKVYTWETNQIRYSKYIMLTYELK